MITPGLRETLALLAEMPLVEMDKENITEHSGAVAFVMRHTYIPLEIRQDFMAVSIALFKVQIQMTVLMAALRDKSLPDKALFTFAGLLVELTERRDKLDARYDLMKSLLKGMVNEKERRADNNGSDEAPTS